MSIPYSITVPTYVYRFESHFKPLLAQMHRQRPNVTKIVFVNGQYDEPFSDAYRREMMNYASMFPNTYLIMSPIFRGCAFMWNTCFNFTSTDYILNINDDISFKEGFFDDFEKILDHNHQLGDESFTLNGAWYHVCMYRPDLLDRVGYVDERFIGLGEEDGDWMHRFEVVYGRPMRDYTTPNLISTSDFQCNVSSGMRIHKGKYSLFNREFMYDMKYEPCETGQGNTCGGRWLIPHKKRKGMEQEPLYYPAEKWYRDNYKRM